MNWGKVVKTDRCWIYTGSQGRGGYCQIKVNGEKKYAHRVAYEELVGPIPEGMTLDHLCRVPNCVNPAHLEPVSHRENVLRGTSPIAQQAQQTHCKHGHEFTPENTKVTRGKRNCRECMRRRANETNHRRRTALRAAATEDSKTGPAKHLTPSEPGQGSPASRTRSGDERNSPSFTKEAGGGASTDAAATERVTHGRHCPCTACASEDWTRITAPCGMHGADCPAEYAPIRAADLIPGAGGTFEVEEPGSLGDRLAYHRQGVVDTERKLRADGEA